MASPRRGTIGQQLKMVARSRGDGGQPDRRSVMEQMGDAELDRTDMARTRKTTGEAEQVMRGYKKGGVVKKGRKK